jgi:ATP-dependent exoDNAse (exonuclease V) beta subunit
MQTANFVVYKSSAGSGKTFTLVKEYLKLAMANDHTLTSAYRSILAITFTNKAAAEMKWRIIKALREISAGTNAMLAMILSDEMQVSQEDLQQRAKVVVTEILHHYSDFSVGTIDSFTHRVIRTFALDLKLPVNFQIETDSDSVFKKVISMLINNLGKDQLITEYLVRFSLDQLEDNKNWDPETTLIEFIREVNKEGAGDLVQQLNHYTISDFEHIRQQLLQFMKSFEGILKAAGEEALQLIHSVKLQATAFASGGAGIYNLYVKLAHLKATSEAELFGANVNKTLQEDKWYGGKATAAEKQAIDSIKAKLEELALKVRAHILENQERYQVYALIYKNIYAIGLVNELAKLTAQYKEEENILFISEFNERISDVVNLEPAPFIFERLGDRYRHFLLDEFQDTSAMQWQNMLPLIDNSLASGYRNLIVGDGKQSIYRWRNADVEQFVSLPEIRMPDKNELIVEREASLIRNFEGRNLRKNFRSETVIVKFNNALFDYLSGAVLSDDMKPIYDQQQQEHKPDEKGYVSIAFPQTAEDDQDVVNAACILNYIHQALSSGYHYSDICIIVRVNRHGNTIANFLIGQGIPVVSAESLLLGKANEINVVMQFLKYVANHKDLVSASAVVNYLHDQRFCNEGQYVSFLRELNITKTKSLYDILALCGIGVDLLKVTASGLLDSCLEIIRALGLQKINAPYIRFFLDEVLAFQQVNTANTILFIEWWEKRREKASVIIPEGMNAVNIMTIHASKGLEFPVVISPYMAWDVESTESIWVEVAEEGLNMPVAMISTTKTADNTVYKPLVEKERQQQAMDNLNLLYVDFTRAVERLHIISPEPKRNSKKNVHSWLKEFALHQAHYDAERAILEFGELSGKISQHSKVSLEPLPVHELNIFSNPDVIEIKGSSTYNVNEEVTKAREYGILVHYLLSQVVSSEDIDEVVSQTLLAGDISEEEASLISQSIKTLISIESIAPYFAPGLDIKNELEILTASGDILRPDRVIITKGQAVVIDYKTGKKNPAKYHAQMQDYEYALLSLGYTSVKKILLYIHEQEVEVVV